jgi:ribosomal protein S18 acetylase RimI-like enzyme
VPAIIQLQRISLPYFDLTDPSPAFLWSFYSFVLRDPNGVLFVSEHDHKLAGFVAGFSAPAHLFQRIASERLRIFGRASICLATHPIQLPRFLGDLRRARRFRCEPDWCRNTICELVAIAVQPRLRVQGHGRALILALAKAARCNKMSQVRVHVSSDDSGMAAFYRRLGFTPLRAFKASNDLWADQYVLALQGNGKVS